MSGILHTSKEESQWLYIHTKSHHVYSIYLFITFLFSVQYMEENKLSAFPVITAQVNLGLGWANSQTS